MTDTTWTEPSAKELQTQVRAIVAEHPSRHRQSSWMVGMFGTVKDLTVDEARAYALTDVPEAPADQERPVCGTTACVAGWLVILGSEPGSVIDAYSVRSPDGLSVSDIWDEAQRLADLSYDQQAWLFSGARTREEVLDGLDALIANPEADLDTLYQVTRTATVTVTDEDGTELYSEPFTVTYDRRRRPAYLVKRAIGRAYDSF